jgi:hypothetical protein
VKRRSRERGGGGGGGGGEDAAICTKANIAKWLSAKVVGMGGAFIVQFLYFSVCLKIFIIKL